MAGPAAQAARAPGGTGAFLRSAFRLAATGSRRYWLWMGALLLLGSVGLAAYARQLEIGLAVSHLSDQVNWGLYISNFMFLGGVAASAMLFVVAVSLYGRADLRPAMPVGISLALASVIMGMLFVQADLGRPDRFWHLIPVIGVFYFPHSMLAWDVLALNVYFVLSVSLAIVVPYRRYRNAGDTALPIPAWVGLVAIAAILFLLVVEAFLFSGFTARPLWNSAVLVPRFVAAAFMAGPALLVLLLQVADRLSGQASLPGALGLLIGVLRVAVQVNLLLLGVEAFVHFYHPGGDSASFRYLYFGLEGQSRLVPWNWSALALGLFAVGVLSVPGWRARRLWLNLACAAAVLQAWIDKGMGLIWAGFIPSPMGEVMEYLPSLGEILVSLGILAIGLIVLTITAKIGLFLAREDGAGRPPGAARL